MTKSGVCVYACRFVYIDQKEEALAEVVVALVVVLALGVCTTVGYIVKFGRRGFKTEYLALYCSLFSHKHTHIHTLTHVCAL